MRRAPQLICAALLLSTSTAALADEPAEGPEVVVTAPKREDRGLGVERLDEKHIERLGAATVGEALEALPSVSAASDSRGERILSLRGFDQREIAVFVDGVPAYLPYDGQLDLSKIPVDMVSRVSVVKGAGSLLYGPNGLGGAISVTTRDPLGTSLRASTEASPFRASRGSLSGAARFGPVSGIVGVGYQSVLSTPLSGSFAPLANESGGDRKSSDRLSGVVSSKWNWDVGPNDRLTLSGNAFEGRFGVPPGTRDFLVRYWRWPDWYARTLSLSHSHRGDAVDTEELVYGSFFGNELAAFDDARYATQRLPKAFTSRYDDVAAGAVVKTAARASLGRGRSLLVRSYTGFRHDLHAGTAAIGAPTQRASTNVLTEAFQGEVDVVPKRLRATAGMEIDGEIPGDSPSATLSPSPALAAGPMVALGVSPHDAISIVASLAWRTRFPTLRERYSSSFDSRIPNPALGAERATHAAIDIVVTPVRGVRTMVSVFDAEVGKLISSVVVAPQTEQFQNVGRARLLGGEAGVSIAPLRWLELEAGWSVLSAKRGARLDEPVGYRPVEKGIVALTVSPWLLSMTAAFRHVGAQDFQNPNTSLWGHLGGYQLLDLRAEIGARALRGWVRVSNLLDTNVEPRFSFPEPGRQFFIGLASRVGD